jgi:hypothetical protein
LRPFRMGLPSISALRFLTDKIVELLALITGVSLF